MAAIESFVGERIGNILREFTGKISSINQKYATPKSSCRGELKLHSSP
jgi:hypothetical protein